MEVIKVMKMSLITVVLFITIVTLFYSLHVHRGV